MKHQIRASEGGLVVLTQAQAQVQGLCYLREERSGHQMMSARS